MTSQGLSGEGGGGRGGGRILRSKIVYLRSTSCSERAISYFTVKTRVIVLIDNIIHGQVNGFFLHGLRDIRFLIQLHRLMNKLPVT